LSPDHAYVNKMLGAVDVNDGRLDRGKSLLLRAVELAPDDAQAWFNLSGAHALLGEYGPARDAAERVLRINPRFPGAREWQAQLESLR
jgi:tetratricopeptide (TPR) repeat protein